MQHAGGQPCQTLEGVWLVQIAQQRRGPRCTQRAHTLGVRRERQKTHMSLLLEHAQAHIATPHDQHTLTSKAAGQGAKGSLIGRQNRGLENIQTFKDNQR